jgi:glycosyltransferase involved in cell wall biosynthesis
MKVSVVVPIFNAGYKLHKCIKSILGQTFTDFELILVNDGSTDSSLDICREYGKKDGRITIIDKHNEGSIRTRRKGIEKASSDYVTFVDADDWIDLRTLYYLYSEAVINDADVTACNHYKVLGDYALFKKMNKSKYFVNDRLYVDHEVKNELIVSFLHGSSFPSGVSAKLYKKELLLNSGKYLEHIKFLGDDLYYNLEVLLKCRKVKLINQPLYYYRTGGFSSKFMPHLFDDMVNGYAIQKQVIEEHFQDHVEKEKRYFGITLMLLNTLQTALYNLINGKLGESKAKELIGQYVSSPEVRECLLNEKTKSRLTTNYYEAIKNADIEYLYHLGLNMYNKRKYKKFIMNALSKAL